MREILFRGKVTKVPKYLKDRMKVGDWVYGSYVSYPVAQIFDLEDEYAVDPATVGQFTGLCDKNSKQIFEGDVVHCEAHLDQADMVVIFEVGQFRLVLCEKFKSYTTGFGYYDINCFNKTVIGNIHDTPDLVKEEAE